MINVTKTHTTQYMQCVCIYVTSVAGGVISIIFIFQINEQMQLS